MLCVQECVLYVQEYILYVQECVLYVQECFSMYKSVVYCMYGSVVL